MISVKTTDFLNDDAKLIREEVFVKEQKFVAEFDEIDNTATHMVIYDDNSPIACCRFFRGEDGEYIAGRLAVLKEHRGRHLGALMIAEIEKCVKALGCKKLSLSAQTRAKGFYEKQGFKAVGDTYFEEYCEHIHMEKMI